MPYSAYSGIKELFVPEEKLEEAKQEAEEMPSIEISTVGLELFFLHSTLWTVPRKTGDCEQSKHCTKSFCPSMVLV